MLPEILHAFCQPLKGNAAIVPKIKTRPLPSTSLQIPQQLFVLSFDAKLKGLKIWHYHHVCISNHKQYFIQNVLSSQKGAALEDTAWNKR
jgi:hypothetical protein